MIEQAYRVAEGMGIAVWCEDEAVPFQTVPYDASSWQLEEHPQQDRHEYLRDGTAKILTLFHPHDGQVRIKGVESATNAVLHPWLKEEFTKIVNALAEVSSPVSPEATQRLWQSWRAGLTVDAADLKRRALDGQHPHPPQQIMERFETVAQVWNQQPKPFEWGGKRSARRQRARERRQQHRGGSGACTQAVIPLSDSA